MPDVQRERRRGGLRLTEHPVHACGEAALVMGPDEGEPLPVRGEVEGVDSGPDVLGEVDRYGLDARRQDGHRPEAVVDHPWVRRTQCLEQLAVRLDGRPPCPEPADRVDGFWQRHQRNPQPLVPYAPMTASTLSSAINSPSALGQWLRTACRARSGRGPGPAGISPPSPSLVAADTVSRGCRYRLSLLPKPTAPHVWVRHRANLPSSGPARRRRPVCPPALPATASR